MKKLILFVLILATTISLKAQKLIALQSGDNATFYNNLDTALYYAKNGDDIYLPGGYIKANSTTLKIDKAVNIIGVGYNPYTNAATGNTIIESSTIEIMSSVYGGSISGVYAKNCMLQIQDMVSNFTVNRCLLTYIIIGNGDGVLLPSNISLTETIVENGIRNGKNTGSPQNVSISNCIIGNPQIDKPLLGMNGWDDLICKNSIIIGNVNYSQPLIWLINQSVFENCIFIEEGGCVQMIGNNCTFRNCMFTGGCAIMQNSFSDNCFFGQNALTTFIDPQDFVFNMKNDYRLQDGSPGKNAGKDGTDIGIYGGRYPWKDGGLPANPHIDTFNVGGNTDTNGTLKVSIKVAAQDH